MTGNAGGDAKKKGEVTTIPTAQVTSSTEACVPIQIVDDKPTQTDLSQICTVLRMERCDRVNECCGAHQAAADIIAADRRCQLQLLFDLCDPPPILPWSSMEAKSSTAQVKVALHRGGPSPVPSTPVAAVAKTNRSRVCYLTRERKIARVRSLSVVAGARRGQIDLWAIFDWAFGPFVR